MRRIKRGFKKCFSEWTLYGSLKRRLLGASSSVCHFGIIAELNIAMIYCPSNAFSLFIVQTPSINTFIEYRLFITMVNRSVERSDQRSVDVCFTHRTRSASCPSITCCQWVPSTPILPTQATTIYHANCLFLSLTVQHALAESRHRLQMLNTQSAQGTRRRHGVLVPESVRRADGWMDEVSDMFLDCHCFLIKKASV